MPQTVTGLTMPRVIRSGARLVHRSRQLLPRRLKRLCRLHTRPLIWKAPGLRGPDGFFVGFQRVENYQPPVWPGQLTPQQLHLDFEVDDLAAAEAALVRMGAAKPQESSGG
jgi:hypothetical protein